MKIRPVLPCLEALFFQILTLEVASAASPNIVYILADDLGYGDVQCLNPERGKIPTPRLDKLATEGMTFTGAHSGSSVCTPTRYGLLTGRYAWRSRLQNGVISGHVEPLIAEDVLTVPEFLKKHGYRSACIGKWHLGFTLDEGAKVVKGKMMGAPVGTKTSDGPITRGFDQYFGFHHARMMKSFYEDDEVTRIVEPVDMLPLLVERTRETITGWAKEHHPFFIYVALNSPHSPVVPYKQWQGKSGIGAYGDFVMETDWAVGEMLDSLDEAGVADNTLVIFTSDNGCSGPAANTKHLEKQGHFASAQYRGNKADIWEGGHRMPFLARWPEKIKPGSTSSQLICHTDLIATCAEILSAELPEKSAPDSVSILPALLGKDSGPLREAVVHHSINGRFSIRQGPWKLEICPGSGGWTNQKDAAALKKGLPPVQAEEARRPNILFILVDDQSPFDFKFYNPESTLDSPNIDRLAAEGMIFDGAYHMGSFSGAVCMPSRHMIMSGRTLWHLPVGPTCKENCPPDIEENVLASVFNRAGYATMRTCKQGNSYPGANKRFTVVHDATKRGGTDETGSAWHAERVLEYLKDRESTSDEKPFFIYFGLSHPHDVRDGKPELLEKYGATNHKDKSSLPALNPKQPPLPPNYLTAHPFENSHMNVRDEIAVPGVWKHRDEATIRNELGREFACSENIDIQIGRVLEKLEEMGELDNTYIIYTADHGMAIGRHGLQGKQNLYEHTWRVPMVVKGPGIKPGTRATGNTYLLDLLATFCDLTGVPAPSSNEGTSFKPVLMGKQDTIRDPLYGVYSGGAKPGMRSVRKGDWKLIQYETADGGIKETQLFNLAENPHEFLQENHSEKIISLTGITPSTNQTDLAENPEHAEKLAEMQALLLEQMRKFDDPYRFDNQPDDGLTPPVKNRGKGR